MAAIAAPPPGAESPYLARIDLYPIKALDGVRVAAATVLASGALEGDRRFALVDVQGKFINGKRNARVHSLRTCYSDDLQQVRFSCKGETSLSFELGGNPSALEDWLSDYFEQPVRLQENSAMGFPDDTDSPGPTVISTASLAAVASWYDDLSLAEVRRRFRTNLEIDGVPAFWEDRLFAAPGQAVPFQLAEVSLLGINPCQRCVVPTRNSQTGAADAGFQRHFVEQRSRSLPGWAEPSRFNHFFRLAVNTRIPATEAGKRLQQSAPLRLLEL
jgi:uncharacterized protein